MDGGLLGFLFRGHGDSRWQLDTTLQRNGHEKYPVRKYYDLISRIKPRIETFTGTNWETPAYSDLETLFREYELFSRRLSFGDLPAYKYMVYLRHHGFPSPLMDWTRSPYVAAYFAFRRITGKHVCIYVFWSR